MEFDRLSVSEQIVELGKNLWQKGMVAANDGNISARLDDGTVVCTPTGVSKGYLTASGLAHVDLDAQLLSDVRPSSEVKMHLRLYRENPDIRAVVHAHPMFATLFAIDGREMTAQVLPETVVALPHVPLAKYGTPSTEEVPDSVAPFAHNYKACLLEQHGALTWGGSIMEAYLGMERLEHLCKTQYLLELRGPVRELSADQINRLNEVFCR